MSGRDMRSFVTNHRSEAEKLVVRVKDGYHSSKYKEVDYEKLKALAAEKKFTGQEKLVKVKKLQQASKHGKEQNLLVQHRAVWMKELSRLTAQRRSATVEVEHHIRQNELSDLLPQYYKDMDSYRVKLLYDLDKFQAGTATPVWDLRSDLKSWIMQKSNMQRRSLEIEEDPEEVQATVEKVKDQQAKLLERLHHEQRVLEEELQIGEFPNINHLPQEKKIQTGIPEEAFNLECPDLDLKASVLQEFIFIDQKYIEKLEDIETQHRTATESATGGWTAEEHFLFLYIIDQYTHDVPNRRMLYIDRLRRHLPHMSRAQIVTHEEWWMLYKYFYERRKDLILDWLRDRKEMMNRAKVVFAEYIASQELQEQKQENRAHQREMCDALYSKVREWREEKMEMMRLQQEQQELRRQVQMDLMQEQETKDKERRDKDRQKIKAFHDKHHADRLKLEEQARKRLEILKNRLEEQATYDKQRVHFRELEMERKEEEKKKKQEVKMAIEGEKQRILEKIREQVRPHVEGDLLRLWSDTESWQARQKQDEEFINIQRPLFNLNTFTANKVASDPRFRLVEKLHEAGLTKNPYAGQALAGIQPLHAPRRDMESTLFKYET